MNAAVRFESFVEPPISRLSATGCLENCNSAYLQMCGYPEQDLLGKSFEMINHPEVPRVVIENIWQTLRKGTPWTGPLRGKEKDGSEFWKLVYIVPLFEAGKELTALGTVYFPIAEEGIERARNLYARLNKGQSPYPLTSRLAGKARQNSLALLATGAAWCAFAGNQLSIESAAVITISLFLAGVQAHWHQRRKTSEILETHSTVFQDPILTPLHSHTTGPSAQLAMALETQRVRMTTVMTRLCINSEVLRQQASTAAAIVSENVAQLDKQATETGYSAAAINQMSATLQDISRDLQQTAQAATRADQLAREGEQLSILSQQSMEATGNAVQGIGSAISRLASAIESISGFAVVIQNIAEQTNLLALNAAIEAARAGDSGRGFAVVADEVRGLASRAADSTREIQEAIEVLRADSREAIAIAERGQAAAHNSRDDAAKTRTSLISICEEVERISSMSQQMAAAVEEQSQVTEQVNQQITEIAKLTDSNLLHADRSKNISRKLSDLAESQLALAKRFLNG